jgi:hypothetical protein
MQAFNLARAGHADTASGLACCKPIQQKQKYTVIDYFFVMQTLPKLEILVQNVFYLLANTCRRRRQWFDTLQVRTSEIKIFHSLVFF